MRKSELKKRLPKKWPEHSTARIIRVDGKKVLMILLPEWRKDCPKIKHNYTAIQGLAHFTWDSGHLTYYRKYDYWTKEGITWIDYNSEVTANTFDDNDYKRMKDFTGYYAGSLESVGYYEQEVRWRLKIKYRDNKQKRINEYMKTVPNLPKDFRKCCIEKLGRKKRINMKLFQPWQNGYISRMFWVERIDEDVRVTEICRAYMHDSITAQWKEWYYGERYYKVGHQQTFWDRKGDSVITVLPNRYYIYDNLDDLNISPAVRSCMRIMEGITDPEMITILADRSPEYEKIIKIGLTRLAADIYSQDTATKMASRLKCLPKDQLQRLIKVNGSEKTWELLKIFPKITDENLKTFNKIKSTEKAKDILKFCEDDGLNLNHLFTLWKKTGGIKMETLTKYNDYLRMAEDLGCDIHDEIIYRDKKWRQRHDVYLEELNRQREEKQKEVQDAIKEKWKGIKRDYDRNTKLFGWKKNGYCIIVPKSAAEINKEGRLQHHCVGAQDDYKNRMATRQSYIVFLRKAENPEKPYYTIECNTSRVIQFYAAYDRQPDKEKVKKILDSWMKQVKKNFAKEKKMEEACAMSHKEHIRQLVAAV